MRWRAFGSSLHHSPCPPPRSIKQRGGGGKVAGGHKQKRARLEVFDKWQKSPGDSQRRKESRPARRSVSGVGSFSRVWPPRRSPCQSVTCLVTLSPPPPPSLYRPHRQPVGLPSLRASQSGRRDAEQSKQTLAAARPTMGGGINGQKLSAAPVASKTHSKPKTRRGAY